MICVLHRESCVMTNMVHHWDEDTCSLRDKHGVPLRFLCKWMTITRQMGSCVYGKIIDPWFSLKVFLFALSIHLLYHISFSALFMVVDPAIMLLLTTHMLTFAIYNSVSVIQKHLLNLLVWLHYPPHHPSSLLFFVSSLVYCHYKVSFTMYVSMHVMWDPNPA